MTQYMAFPKLNGPLHDNVQGNAQGNIVTRFAPSPNGPLHVGHAYAAIMAHDFARMHGGRFLLRIEDIDGNRSRAEHVEAIIADMKWLGVEWDGDVIFQSTRIARYRRALGRLHDMGILYRCTCTRGEIMAALKTKPVLHGPDGPHYPGTCRTRALGEVSTPYAWRMDMQAAVKLADERVGERATGQAAGQVLWHDLAAGGQLGDPSRFGDIILWRKDAPASYHLAATLDDGGDDRVTHIVRGRDLFAYSALHRLLQILLDLPEPVYWHHDLLLGADGEKLSKSKGSGPLSERRIAGEDGREFAKKLRKGILPLGISVSQA